MQTPTPIVSKSFPSRPWRPEDTQHSKCGSCSLAQWNSCPLEKESSAVSINRSSPHSLHQLTPGNKTKASWRKSSPRYAPLLFTCQQGRGHSRFVICHYLFSCSHKQMGNIPPAGSTLQGWPPGNRWMHSLRGPLHWNWTRLISVALGCKDRLTNTKGVSEVMPNIRCVIDFQIWFAICITKEQRRRKT